ncbi:crcB protein [Luminiphilus syltensis NOR5-1B]|uniref:Fluoride-specific ion channel FluC n=1 Tax=Luminiphilus syltensis NOR5-1B TaxID=565045 RepID=B8KRK4_9GAMM|nr:fluoride efflux transporter CrcB [Luminiphilus syltensis]EED35926.1 crcB protein [Luminiphilus syltensis NOR5-1B]
MTQWLLVALGGALGAMARFGSGALVRHYIIEDWPLATLLVNVTGSLGIGVLFVLLERGMIHGDFRALLVIGFFGAFTTFSTFSLEMLHMIEAGDIYHGVLYAALSIFCCLAGVTAGVYLARGVA